MLKNTLTLILSIYLFSCKNQSNSPGLSGTISNLEKGDELFLDYLTPNNLTLQ